MSSEKTVSLVVNDASHVVTVDISDALLKVLREDLGLTGTKQGCDYGGCGCCTVEMEGKPILSCMMPAWKCNGNRIVTIEGVSNSEQLNPVQEAFVRMGAFQCGFCTPGMVIVSKCLLEDNPNPTKDEVKEVLSGVLCRCTGGIIYAEAVLEAAKALRGRG